MKDTPEYAGSNAVITQELFERLPVEDLKITPLRADFARKECDIREAFDWADIVRRADEKHSFKYGQVLYLVAFRSQRKPDADVDMLNEYDAAAHMDAAVSDGYITYFKGESDEQGFNLSFCIWHNTSSARAATSQPNHVKAARLARDMYVEYKLEQYWACRNTDNSVVLIPI